jgi:hypothetical protein
MLPAALWPPRLPSVGPVACSGRGRPCGAAPAGRGGGGGGGTRQQPGRGRPAAQQPAAVRLWRGGRAIHPAPKWHTQVGSASTGGAGAGAGSAGTGRALGPGRQAGRQTPTWRAAVCTEHHTAGVAARRGGTRRLVHLRRCRVRRRLDHLRCKGGGGGEGKVLGPGTRSRGQMQMAPGAAATHRWSSGPGQPLASSRWRRPALPISPSRHMRVSNILAISKHRSSQPAAPRLAPRT